MVELDINRATEILHEMQALMNKLEKKREELVRVASGKNNPALEATRAPPTDKDIEDILAFTFPARKDAYQPRGLSRSRRETRTRRGTEESEWIYHGREYCRIAKLNDLGTPDICRRKGRRSSCVWLTEVECQLIREQTYKRRLASYKRRVGNGETNVPLRPCIAAAEKSDLDES